MLIGIVAMTESGLIGRGDGLPWHIPDDLRFFRSLTLNKTLIAGRKTWEGMPRLADRQFVLYTSQKDFSAKGIKKVVTNTDEVVDLAFSSEVYYLIGGAYMFEQFSHLCDYFYVTEIQEDENTRFEGDVYFRRELLEKYFEVASETAHTDKQTGHKLIFKTYRRKGELA